ATTEIYTLSLHDALPIFSRGPLRARSIWRPVRSGLRLWRGQQDIQLDRPFGLARFGTRIRPVRLVTAYEQVPRGIVPTVERVTVGGGPVDQMPIGTPGVVAVGHRGVPAGWQQPGAYALVAVHRLFGDRPDLKVHRAVHVDHMQPQEQRAGLRPVVAAEPAGQFRE